MNKEWQEQERISHSIRKRIVKNGRRKGVGKAEGNNESGRRATRGEAGGTER